MTDKPHAILGSAVSGMLWVSTILLKAAHFYADNISTLSGTASIAASLATIYYLFLRKKKKGDDEP